MYYLPVAVLLTLAAAALVLQTVPPLRWGLASRRWRQVRGRIEKAEYYAGFASSRTRPVVSGPVATYVLQYVYRADGARLGKQRDRPLEGHRLRYGSLTSHEMRGLIEQYTPGQEVMVSMDPSHPGRSVLVPGVSRTAILTASASSAALLGGLTWTLVLLAQRAIAGLH